MGSRKPTTLRPRRGAIKCEYCGRSVSSPQALESHQKTLHSAALRRRQTKQDSKKPLAGKPKLKLVRGNGGKVAKNVLRTKAFIDKSNKLIFQRNGVHKGVNEAFIESKAKRPVGRPKKHPKPPHTKTENTTILEKSTPKRDKSKDELITAKMDAQNTGDKLKTSLLKKKTEFKCPKCEKVFSMCFSAQKHIKKHHCVNGEGDKVDPDSPDLIQPIEVQSCDKCNIQYTDVHSCNKRAPSPDTLSLSNLGPYGCVACLKTFDRLMNFQKHVSSMHNDGLESLLFPTLQEFETWRSEMESQTKTLYVHIGTMHDRHMYQCCSTQSDLNDLSGALSCPSLLIYQHYPSGIQVHFYKRHFDHECKPYCMDDMYKNYSLTDMLLPATDLINTMKADKGPTQKDHTEIKEEVSDEQCTPSDHEQDPEEDLYVKFKSIMNNIINDAAKINITSLKTLVEQADKMQQIIRNYKEDIDMSLDNSSLNSINTSFENSTSNNKSNKRKSETISIISPMKKKAKTNNVNTSPVLQNFNACKIVNSYSLADNKDDDKILKQLHLKKSSSLGDNATPNDSPKKMVTFPKFDCSPSAFHDSYKNFVSNIAPTKNNENLPKSKKSKQTNKQKSKSSPKFKTRIGQFNPESPTRLVNKQKDSPKSINKRRDSVKSINKRRDSVKSINKRRDSVKSINKQTDSPKSIDEHRDSPKRITRESTKSETENPIQKVFKAKGGPKYKRRVRDFKYEVKERANDCNILILKI